MSLFLEQHASFIKHGYIRGQLYLVDNYPGAIITQSGERVFGDVFGFDDEDILSKIDEFEEVNVTNEYSREVVTVFTESGPLSCWTYLYNRPTHQLPRIITGDFLRYLNE